MDALDREEHLVVTIKTPVLPILFKLLLDLYLKDPFIPDFA